MRRRTLAIAVTLSATLAALSLSAASAEPSWHAKGTGLLDCNGHSPVQRVVKQLQCAEIAANEDDGFEDNGHYVGHDEADIGWFSTQPGSSTRARWNVTLPVDPPGPASTSFSGPVADFQLTVALVRHGALRQRELSGRQPRLHDHRCQHSGPTATGSRRGSVCGASAVPTRIRAVHQEDLLRHDPLVRRNGDLQPAGPIRRSPRSGQPSRSPGEQQLRRAGQLRLPHPEREPGPATGS